MNILIGLIVFLIGFVGGMLFAARNHGKVVLAKDYISAELDEWVAGVLSKTDLDEKMKLEYLKIKDRLEKLRKKLEALGF